MIFIEPGKARDGRTCLVHRLIEAVGERETGGEYGLAIFGYCDGLFQRPVGAGLRVVDSTGQGNGKRNSGRELSHVI